MSAFEALAGHMQNRDMMLPENKMYYHNYVALHWPIKKWTMTGLIKKCTKLNFLNIVPCIEIQRNVLFKLFYHYRTA